MPARHRLHQQGNGGADNRIGDLGVTSVVVARWRSASGRRIVGPDAVGPQKGVDGRGEQAAAAGDRPADRIERERPPHGGRHARACRQCAGFRAGSNRRCIAGEHLESLAPACGDMSDRLDRGRNGAEHQLAANVPPPTPKCVRSTPNPSDMTVSDDSDALSTDWTRTTPVAETFEPVTIAIMFLANEKSRGRAVTVIRRSAMGRRFRAAVFGL